MFKTSFTINGPKLGNASRCTRTCLELVQDVSKYQ